MDRAVTLEGVDIRWNNQVIDVQAGADEVLLTIKTPDGNYTLACDYLLVADGANSSVRQMLGLGVKGEVFNDQFLITDIRMKSELPTERRFHFDPPFHPNQSVLLHRQADDVWRIDFQLGPDADPAEALLPAFKSIFRDNNPGEPMKSQYNINQFKLVVSDLDGTIKDTDQPIHPFTIDVLTKLPELGIHFTLASGRSLASLRPYAEELKIKIPMVLANGCIIQSLDGTIHFREPMPVEVTRKIFKITDQENSDLVVFSDDRLYFKNMTDNIDRIFGKLKNSVKCCGFMGCN